MTEKRKSPKELRIEREANALKKNLEKRKKQIQVKIEKKKVTD